MKRQNILHICLTITEFRCKLIVHWTIYFYIIYTRVFSWKKWPPWKRKWILIYGELCVSKWTSVVINAKRRWIRHFFVRIWLWRQSFAGNIANYSTYLDTKFVFSSCILPFAEKKVGTQFDYCFNSIYWQLLTCDMDKKSQDCSRIYIGLFTANLVS